MKNLSKSDTCFILVPGFDNTIRAVSRLDVYLRKEGYTTKPIYFWGRGDVDFSTLTMEQCVQSIAKIIEETSKEYPRVIGIGTSLGAALLLDYAKNNNHLSSIVSIGAPFELKYEKLFSLGIKTIYPLLRAWWKAIRRNSKWLAGPEVVNYLSGRFQKNIEHIKTPVLFLHSTRDTVALYRAIEDYFADIKTVPKKNVYVPGANHILWGYEELVLKELTDFIIDNDFASDFLS